MNTIESLKWRYAVKKFDTNSTLAPSQIEILKEAFNLTATSYGLQPLKLAVINNKNIQEELLVWNRNQAYIALGNLLTVCAVEQIDACPMEGFVPAKYDEVLGLNKQNLTATLVLPVGFRAEDDYMKDLKKVRKNIEDVVIEFN